MLGSTGSAVIFFSRFAGALAGRRFLTGLDNPFLSDDSTFFVLEPVSLLAVAFAGLTGAGVFAGLAGAGVFAGLTGAGVGSLEVSVTS